ncbi:MAG TPA: SDR family oxidoreductase [Polyangiaceae bacterium]|jgi:NAD(P)-dependent dehydrogenase (short-subunit alcohol dehydrogenase family)|nr:SDR family oxidoreductase [Polyangiaceae bacterium]
MSASELFSIKGKVAVVTGGSRGIGLMIARGFVEAGARVYIAARKAQACDEAAAELSKLGECISVPADLATVEGATHLAAKVGEREKALHILVNNAGATWGAPLEEFPDAGWDKIMGVNVKGVFHLTVKLLPLLRKAASKEDPARVINIGSIDGLRVPHFDNFSYSASKAAVHMLTRHLASTLVKEHVNVNAIAPGLFPSKMTQFVFDGMGEEGASQNIPMARAGRQDDIAGTCIYLSSRAGSYLTGAVIPVDGGMSTH